jgi:hypothetical protein
LAWKIVRVRFIGYAAISGFFLMLPVALLFNAMHWPLLGGWAMGHVGFVVAWPVLTLLSFWALVYLDSRRRSH